MSQGTTRGSTVIVPQVDTTPTEGSSNPVSSNGVFDALSLKQNIVSGVSDTEIGYLDGVTSAIQTQVDSKLNKNKFIRQNLTTITGVTGQSVICSILIPANTYVSGEGFDIIAAYRKSATVSNITFNIYHDTVVNGISSTINSGFIVSTALSSVLFIRSLFIDGTTLRNAIPAAANSASPYTNFPGSAASTTTFNPSVNNYITITGNPTVVSEVVGVNFVSIRPL
jgi:hypothetical protein